MTRENLARGFKPAGFEQPEGSRHIYTKPRAELKYAFERWLDQAVDVRYHETEYREACKLIRHLGKIPYREANSLLFDFDPQTEREMDVGFFISACYNRSPEKVIIFDVDAPDVDCIGYRLGKNKVLVNNNRVRFVFGWESSGIIVNNGYMDTECGTDCFGVVLNNGSCTRLFGADSSGIVINAGKAGSLSGSKSSGILIWTSEKGVHGETLRAKAVLQPDDVEKIPEMKKYLDELSEMTKAIKDYESAERFLKRYGKMPRERIETEIKEILRSAGI